MTERPIIFTAESVRAILANQKSQTPRLAKFVPLDGVNLSFSGLSVGHFDTGRPETGWVLYSRGSGGVWQQRTEPLLSRYQVGDRLWVKEAWALESCGRDGRRIIWRSDRAAAWKVDGPRNIFYMAHDYEAQWRSPLFMPRWASRISLEVTEVRAQRTQEISDEDAIAEGFAPYTDPAENVLVSAKWQFRQAWDLINGKRAPWTSNPWVWAVTFRRIER